MKNGDVDFKAIQFHAIHECYEEQCDGMTIHPLIETILSKDWLKADIMLN
jgi:hypothetical protein